jgi:hypothetical protein
MKTTLKTLTSAAAPMLAAGAAFTSTAQATECSKDLPTAEWYRCMQPALDEQQARQRQALAVCSNNSDPSRCIAEHMTAPQRAGAAQAMCLTDNCLPQLSPAEMTAKNRAAAARFPHRTEAVLPSGASKMPCIMKSYSDLVIHGTSDIDVMERCDIQPSEIAFILDQIVDGNPQLSGPTPFKDAHCRPTYSGFACEYNGVAREWVRRPYYNLHPFD